MEPSSVVLQWPFGKWVMSQTTATDWSETRTRVRSRSNVLDCDQCWHGLHCNAKKCKFCHCAEPTPQKGDDKQEPETVTVSEDAMFLRLATIAYLVDGTVLNELPPWRPLSLGSLRHPELCRPCAWFARSGGCRNGLECLHCHSCEPTTIKSATRVRRGWGDRQPLSLPHISAKKD